MRILFFDLEEVGLHKATIPGICEFGYVVTNEELKVLERNEIVINPNLEKNDWDWWFLKNMSYFNIKYYANQPSLSFYFERIKKLIETSDYVIGHSLSSDAFVLEKELKRLNLPTIEYTFFDVSTMFKKMKRMKNQTALTKILEFYNIKGDTNSHKADADAYNTMLVFKQMLAESGKSIKKFLQESKYAKDHILDGKINSFEENFQKHLKTFNLILQGKEEDGSEMKFSRWSLRLFLENQILFRNQEGIFKKIKFCLDKKLVEKNFRFSLNLIKIINEKGGQVSDKKEDSNIFITIPKSLIDEERSNYYKSLPEKYQNLKVKYLDDFLIELQISFDELNSVSYPNFKFLLSDKANITSKKDKQYIQHILHSNQKHDCMHCDSLESILGNSAFEMIRQKLKL